jgi:flagellar protein FlgJ
MGGAFGADVKNLNTKTPLNKQPEEAAKQFEALLVKQMLDSMWSTVPKGGIVSGSNEESLYRDMFNEALSNSISEGKGIGIKDVILKDFNKINKK